MPHDHKIHKNYRLSQRTVKQIEWLAWRLDTTATAIIERAVDELYEKIEANMRSRLIPGEDGWYHLLVDNLPLMSIPEEDLPKLEGLEAELLTEEGVSGDRFLVALLRLGASAEERDDQGRGLILYDDNILKLYSVAYEQVKGQALQEEEPTEVEPAPAG